MSNDFAKIKTQLLRGLSGSGASNVDMQSIKAMATRMGLEFPADWLDDLHSAINETLTQGNILEDRIEFEGSVKKGEAVTPDSTPEITFDASLSKEDNEREI